MAQRALPLRIVDRLVSAAQTFWGPGDPVAPALTPTPEAPRLTLYPPGSNSVITPRGERPTPSTFDVLRALASSYDVAAICIAHLCQELSGLEWAIVPAPHAPKDSAKRLAAAIAVVTEFLSYPDGEQPFDQWAGMLLAEDLEIAAPVVYKRPTRSGKGLASLDIIEGDLIKPLIDIDGRIAAYQQTYAGVVYGQWPKEQVIYAPRLRRRSSVYGIAPLERVLLTVNTALRRQTWQLAYYTDGNIPEALAGTPESWTPDMIREFQEWFDGLMVGDDAARRRIKMWPGDTSKIHEFRPYAPTTEPETWLLQICCAIFGVRPEEIGFTADTNRATADAQALSGSRTVRSIARWMENILTRVIQVDLGHRDLVFRYQPPAPGIKLVEQAQADEIYTGLGVYDAPYIRQRDGVQLAENSPLLSEAAHAEADPATPDAPLSAEQAADGPLDPEAAVELHQAAAVADLRKWRGKALRRLSAGKPAGCPFTSPVIPSTQATALQTALGRCATPADVRAVFALAGLPIPSDQ